MILKKGSKRVYSGTGKFFYVSREAYDKLTKIGDIEARELYKAL